MSRIHGVIHDPEPLTDPLRAASLRRRPAPWPPRESVKVTVTSVHVLRPPEGSIFSLFCWTSVTTASVATPRRLKSAETCPSRYPYTLRITANSRTIPSAPNTYKYPAAFSISVEPGFSTHPLPATPSIIYLAKPTTGIDHSSAASVVHRIVHTEDGGRSWQVQYTLAP
jgi:hypothetical protein